MLQGYFITPESRRFDLVFFDGNRFEYSNIDSPINHVCASENDDWMSSWSDEGISLDGRGGNDNLTGGAGNDVLRGGTGNDTIAGGMGDDIYKYKLGDGFDTIIDSTGINKIIFEDVASSNVTYAFDLNNDTINVVITLIETGDSIVINEYNEGNYIFEFSDGIYGSVTILDGIATFIQTNGE